MYSEASDFFNATDKRYPGKRDLTKTIEYMAWKKKHTTASKTERAKPVDPEPPNQEPSTPPALKTKRAKTITSTAAQIQEPSTPTIINNFELRIPLMEYKTSTQTETDETLDEGTTGPVPHGETLSELVSETVETVKDQMHIYPSILEEISPELFTQLIQELEADPDLNKIFYDIDVQQDLEYPELDIDIDIDPLEIELTQW